MKSKNSMAELIYSRMYDETYFDAEEQGLHARISEAFAEECAQVEKALFFECPELFVFEPGVMS